MRVDKLNTSASVDLSSVRGMRMVKLKAAVKHCKDERGVKSISLSPFLSSLNFKGKREL